MKTIIRSTLAAAVLSLMTGCETTGLSYHERAGVTYSNYILGLQPKQPDSKSEKLVTPIHLAVAQVGEAAPPENFLNQLNAAQMLVASATALPLPGEEPGQRFGAQNSTEDISKNFGDRVKSICRVAQSVGADYLFIFGGSIDSQQQGSPLRVLDFTLVGTVLIPSTEIKVEGKAAGVLIRTADGEPVFFVNVESRRSGVAPTDLAQGKSETLQTELRDDLSKKLADELLQKLAVESAKAK